MTGREETEGPKGRGLPSIQKAREERASGKGRWPSPKFWAYGGLILAISLILHWKWSSGEIERSKQKLLADQRAVKAEIGPRWSEPAERGGRPLRTRVEAWTMDLAKGAGPEVVDKETLAKWDFREHAGIYLRLRVEEAGSVEDIRKGAAGSLRDGFTSCLMRVKNASPTEGPPCKRNRDCPAREFCNEQDHCSRPAQPFNLRVAYRTLNILSDEWVRDVQGIDSELRMRLFQTSFADAVRDDLPLAAEVLAQAQYFLVLLDETPKGTTAPPGASLDEVVQGVPHFARVAVWRLSDDKPVLRVRRDAGGELIGTSPEVDTKVLEARARQANSCALALSVREAMGDTAAAGVPPQ
jgi:hypothetical protein